MREMTGVYVNGCILCGTSGYSSVGFILFRGKKVSYKKILLSLAIVLKLRSDLILNQPSPFGDHLICLATIACFGRAADSPPSLLPLSLEIFHVGIHLPFDTGLIFFPSFKRAVPFQFAYLA